MNRILRSAVVSTAAAMFWLCPAEAFAQFRGCQQIIGGRAHINDYICPPPLGDLTVDLMGNFVCGEGQCVTQSDGKIRCAAEPGGMSVVDSTGQAKCVGGCVDASISFCQTPVY